MKTIIILIFRSLIVVTLSSHTLSASNFIGSSKCKTCHERQYQDWHNSHHDKAMEAATSDSVLGNFNQASFFYNGVKSQFFQRTVNGVSEYWVNTENSQGKLQDFKIDYTFGVYPLQQYLIKFDDGRYQALSVAWDSRPKEEGGQRWFHLYPDEHITHDDALHWTGPYQTWNNKCADCHSTNLQKNYDTDSDSYQTTWSEIDVGCEACHGRASEHLTWANDQNPRLDHKGFEYSLKALDIGRVLHQSRTTKQPNLSQSEAQIAVCGSCHSRRAVVGDISKAGSFHNKHRLSLVNEPYYYPDGQIKDEVYVLGSFLQSKMYHQGVVCSHCHNPHSLALKVEGNGLCTQCHAQDTYDTKDHHHHTQTSSGGQCVNCHMPETTYMVVDPRRDHSFKIPRPDLSEQYQTPNACTQCHLDQNNAWATDALHKWLAESDKTLPDLPPLLLPPEQALKLDIPSITRASVINRLDQNGSPNSIQIAQQQLENESPLVQAAAARALKSLRFNERYRLLKPLIDHKVKSVRIAVAEALANHDLMHGLAGLDAESYKQVRDVLTEYEAILRLDEDTTVGLVNIGLFYTVKQEYYRAEQVYKKALTFNDEHLIVLLNLADLYRVQAKHKEAVTVLEQAISRYPMSADANHAMGLALVRIQRHDEAVAYLKAAASENFHYGYVYAVALHSIGEFDLALAQSALLLEQQADNNEVLSIALDSSLKLRKTEEALNFAKRLFRLNPRNNHLNALIEQLQ